MADADDKLDFCKQALGELGTRSTITSLDPPDGSQEAYYCNLFFNGTRDQILRAAHWGFAGRTDVGVLWKALAGTPENPGNPGNYQWSNRDPAQPWLYSYLYPGANAVDSGVVAVRRVRGQQLASDGAIPFYGGVNLGFVANQLVAVPFEIASDQFDQAGNLIGLTQRATVATIVNPGTGYRSGDYITLTGGGSVYGNPAIAHVLRTVSGVAQEITIIGNGGSFTVAAASTMTQLSTTGSGTGLTCTVAFAAQHSPTRVVLTNAQNAIFDMTVSVVGVAEYDPLFADAFMLALEGKLALALIGDRALYTAKLQEANNSIINARVRDGNEGLTTYDFVPDWLQVRGVSSMSSPTGGWYNPPYGPLFAV